jgi:hypothetical protein
MAARPTAKVYRIRKSVEKLGWQGRRCRYCFEPENLRCLPDSGLANI